MASANAVLFAALIRDGNSNNAEGKLHSSYFKISVGLSKRSPAAVTNC